MDALDKTFAVVTGVIFGLGGAALLALVWAEEVDMIRGVGGYSLGLVGGYRLDFIAGCWSILATLVTLSVLLGWWWALRRLRRAWSR